MVLSVWQTEAFDNDGIGNALENMIITGGSRYYCEYRDGLRLFLNRNQAEIDSETYQDHTCFTMSHAGSSAGFYLLLQVYLDHILHPLLKEEDYIPGVHYINGDGLDAGVLYNEVKEREETPTSLVDIALKKVLYPGNSRYGYEFEGSTENLRNSTNVEKVRAYHEKYYRPENLVLTITGNVDIYTLLHKLNVHTICTIRGEGCYNRTEPFVRPWQNEIERNAMNQVEEIIVEYPADDELEGNVVFAWRLPGELADDIQLLQGYKFITNYFEAEFTWSKESLSARVKSKFLELKEPSVQIIFENVETDRMDDVVQEVETWLNNIVTGGPDKLNLRRIQTLLTRCSNFGLVVWKYSTAEGVFDSH